MVVNCCCCFCVSNGPRDAGPTVYMCAPLAHLPTRLGGWWPAAAEKPKIFFFFFLILKFRYCACLMFGEGKGGLLQRLMHCFLCPNASSLDLYSLLPVHTSLSCILLGVHPIFSEDRQGTALSFLVLALVFAAARFVLRLGARKVGRWGRGVDRKAGRGDEGVSQRLRAGTLSLRWALRIADHSAFLPPCLPRPEDHGTLPSFS